MYIFLFVFFDFGFLVFFLSISVLNSLNIYHMVLCVFAVVACFIFIDIWSEINLYLRFLYAILNPALNAEWNRGSFLILSTCKKRDIKSHQAVISFFLNPSSPKVIYFQTHCFRITGHLVRVNLKKYPLREHLCDDIFQEKHLQQIDKDPIITGINE